MTLRGALLPLQLIRYMTLIIVKRKCMHAWLARCTLHIFLELMAVRVLTAAAYNCCTVCVRIQAEPMDVDDSPVPELPVSAEALLLEPLGE
jgi:hypothetical protein